MFSRPPHTRSGMNPNQTQRTGKAPASCPRKDVIPAVHSPVLKGVMNGSHTEPTLTLTREAAHALVALLQSVSLLPPASSREEDAA